MDREPTLHVPWQVLSERTLVSRRWLEVREQHVRLSNGHEIPEYHLIHGPRWTGVLCVTRDERLVMVRQYRHGIGEVSLELPAGVIEPGEEPAAAAQRELLEETGFAASDWQPLIAMATEPTRHSTRAHFFAALGAERVSGTSFDASEQIELVLVPKQQALELVERGQVAHAVHIAALLFAARRGLLG